MTVITNRYLNKYNQRVITFNSDKILISEVIEDCLKILNEKNAKIGYVWINGIELELNRNDSIDEVKEQYLNKQNTTQ